jgi:glycerophosphoryl diester phosphodiesterase
MMGVGQAEVKALQIVAHRGVSIEAPENTVASFQRALDLGADAVELDVRLTADHVPVVYHYFYLEETSSTEGAIFDFTWDKLRKVDIRSKNYPGAKPGKIPALAEILDTFGGKLGLEIELKGPEPEAAVIVGDILNGFKSCWNTIEVTSYEPALLLAIQGRCPELATDLLYPPSPEWMKPDVMLYEAMHRCRLARARAVHLQPGQLSETVVATLRGNGIEVHAWDVNEEQDFEMVRRLDVHRMCTDRFPEAHAFRLRQLAR